MERLHKELDQTRHELEAKEHQITSLLRETSSQLDVVHLVRRGLCAAFLACRRPSLGEMSVGLGL